MAAFLRVCERTSGANMKEQPFVFRYARSTKPRRVFFMPQNIPVSVGGGSSSSFRNVVAAFLASGALPFARVLSAERVERVFAKHGGLFGRRGIDSTAMMVWSFLGQVRCKSPDMVRRELWTTLLGYNLIRTTAGGAPRQTAASDQFRRDVPVRAGLLEAALLRADPRLATGLCQRMLRQIAACEVANRPGRLEPRALKRRKHGYPLMEKPRETLRADLRNHWT
jgi:hypothetical protein